MSCSNADWAAEVSGCFGGVHVLVLATDNAFASPLVCNETFPNKFT